MNLYVVVINIIHDEFNYSEPSLSFILAVLDYIAKIGYEPQDFTQIDSLFKVTHRPKQLTHLVSIFVSPCVRCGLYIVWRLRRKGG